MFLDPQQIVVRNSIQVEPKLYEKSSTEVDLDCKKKSPKSCRNFRQNRLSKKTCLFTKMLLSTSIACNTKKTEVDDDNIGNYREVLKSIAGILQICSHH